MSFVINKIKQLYNSKEVKNAGWLIGGRVIQMVLSFFIGILTARFLGPSNFGLISYCSSYTAFFTSFCTLGINYIIVKELIDNPNNQGGIIGSTIVLRAVSSILSAVMIVSVISIVDRNEYQTLIVAILCSIALVFQVFDTLNYWFQSKYQSKATAIATLIAYLAVSGYRIALLALNKDVVWFAFATSVDYIVLALVLLLFYKYYKGPRFSFSWKLSKSLLKKSYNYILSGMMVAIYSQTDKVMLKHMLSESEVGYYSIAATISTLWVFVLIAIIDSMSPTIINCHKNSKLEFDRKNMQLYCLVFYISCLVSIILLLFAHPIVVILYGEPFSESAGPLKVITWYVAFSYLGVARNTWIVCTNNQKYLKYIYASAALINVVLNLLLIPLWGAVGAAAASLITQIATSILLPLFIAPLKENALLILKSIVFKGFTK